MLNLHSPFRLARAEDRAASERLPQHVPDGEAAEVEVVAEIAGEIRAALSGRSEGQAWRVTRLAIAADRLQELGPRLLALTDALAADEGLASVVLNASRLGPDLRAIAEQEGFRAGLDGELIRPVVPQG